jgi:phage/plasmid-like protein (TIGR03299 family)
MPFEEQRVLYRSDTHAPLSVVSQRFQEVQPMEILHFYRDLTEQSGFELETAGVLKGGKKFWALARTGQSSALKGKDVSNGYILLATACDGTLATTAQFTSIRVVCNNTLAIALRGQQGNSGVVKVPHSTRFDAEKVKQQLGISVRAWDEHMYEMKQLSQRKVTQQKQQLTLMRCLTIPVSVWRNRMKALFSSTAMQRCQIKQAHPKQTIKLNRMDEPCRKS